MIRALISLWMRLIAAMQSIRKHFTLITYKITGHQAKEYDLNNHDFVPPLDAAYDVFSNSDSVTLWNKMAAMMDYTYPTKGSLIQTKLSAVPRRSALKYCVQYAAYSYFYDVLDDPQHLKIIKKKEVKAFSEQSLKVENAAYFIGVDKQQKAILVCIRGTRNWGDTLTDLDCHAEHVEFGTDSDGQPIKFWAHHGIFDAAHKIYDEITLTVKQWSNMTQYEDYKILLTGHSLGAGIASLLALLWNVRRDFHDKDFLCCSFASPLVVDQDGMHHSLTFNNILSVAVSTDLVTRLSLSAFHKFHGRLQLIATDKQKSEALIDSICRKRIASEQHDSFIRELSEEEFDLLHKLKQFDTPQGGHRDLYPCGDLIWSVPHFVADDSMSDSMRYNRLQSMVEWQSGSSQWQQVIYLLIKIVQDFFVNHRQQVLTKPAKKSDRSKFQQIVFNGLESFHAHFPGRYTAPFGVDMLDVFALSTRCESWWRPTWLSQLICLFQVTAKAIKHSL